MFCVAYLNYNAHYLNVFYITVDWWNEMSLTVGICTVKCQKSQIGCAVEVIWHNHPRLLSHFLDSVNFKMIEKLLCVLTFSIVGFEKHEHLLIFRPEYSV